MLDLAGAAEHRRRLEVLDRVLEDARDELLCAAEAVVDAPGDQAAVEVLEDAVRAVQAATTEVEAEQASSRWLR